MKKVGFVNKLKTKQAEMEKQQKIAEQDRIDAAKFMAEYDSSKKSGNSTFNRLVKNKKGSMDIEDVIFYAKVIGIGFGGFIAIVLLCSPIWISGIISGKNETEIKNVIEYENENFAVELADGTVLRIDKVDFVPSDKSKKMIAYCTEIVDGNISNKIIVANFTEEEYNKIKQIDEDYKKASNSSPLSKKKTNKYKEDVKNYYSSIKEIVAGMGDRVSVATLPNLDNSL